MKFKKIVGILQIILSVILVIMPIIILILLKTAIRKINQNIQILVSEGVATGMALQFLDVLKVSQWYMIFIIGINSIIALSLILQGVVNIKE